MSKLVKTAFLAILVITLNGCSEDTLEQFPTGKITGKVVTLGDNEPIENVKVSTNPSSSTVFSDENGDFTINDVREGDYSVQAEKEGLLDNFEGITVTVNGTVNVIFEMQPETANNRPPDAPVLITPVNNATDLGVEVLLEWSGSDPDDDTLTYEVEILNDQNSDVLAFENLTDTTLTVSGLSFGYKYFWQVSASDGINSPSQSEVFTFETLDFPNNRFLYVKKVGGNNVIYSSDEDGNEIQLTSSSNNSWRPRKSVVADKIAFLRTDGAETHLYTMNPDGSDVFKVTNTVSVNGFDLDEVKFSWSGNGSQLLYANFDRLYTINADGSGLQMIYETADGSFITECDWSNDGTLIALKTNNANGYNISIYTINMAGTIQTTVLSGVTGAAGNVNLSVNNQRLLYTYDVSGFESPDYRQLDTKMFVYDFGTSTASDASLGKLPGTNDLEARFSPNEAQVIFVNTSNDGLSEHKIFIATIGDQNSRAETFPAATMPDWE